MPEHRGTILLEGVAGADAGEDLGGKIAACEGEGLNLGQGAVEVLLHVVRERFEGGDVDNFGAGAEGSGDGLAEELIDADEKRGEGLAGASGSRDEGSVAGEDVGPAGLLGLGGGAELRHEPLLHDGVGPGERGEDGGVGGEHGFDSSEFARCSLLKVWAKSAQQ
jgi:hypothetical protein